MDLTLIDFDSPTEVREFDKGRFEVYQVGPMTLGRATYEPGWKWSDCIKPLAKTDSCQLHHEGTLIQGRMHVKHDDGTEIDIGPGDAYVIQPGHDAWVVGDEAAVGFEFDSSAAEQFAARD